MIKYKNDAIFRGIVTVKKANWSKCESINCKLISNCQSKKIEDVECFASIPLVEVTESKLNLSTFEVKGNRLKRLFCKLIARLKYKNGIHNNTAQAYLDNICKHIAGESTPDLSISYCGLSAAFDPSDKDSSLENEIDRVATGTPSRNENVVTVTSNFGGSDGNTLSTTVSSATSTTVFDLTSVTGLQVGDALQIVFASTNRAETRKISNIASNTITVDTAYSEAPAVSDVANQLIQRLHLVSGGSATLDSGTAISIAPFEQTKSSSETLQINHTIKLIGN